MHDIISVIKKKHNKVMNRKYLNQWMEAAIIIVRCAPPTYLKGFCFCFCFCFFFVGGESYGFHRLNWNHRNDMNVNVIKGG